jgi:hypothetical protein
VPGLHDDVAAKGDITRQLDRDHVRASEDTPECGQVADLTGKAQEVPVQIDAGVIGPDVDRQLTDLHQRILVLRPRVGIVVVEAARADRIAVPVIPITWVGIRIVLTLRRVRGAGLLPPPALRTVREGFPSHGSSMV